MKRKPVIIYLLPLLMLFQALSGLGGGLMLMLGPHGAYLHMPLSMLDRTPFKSFFIPGMILFLILGVFPGFIFYGLMFTPKWKHANVLNVYRKRHWSWTYTIYTGIMLIIWIDVEVIMIGCGSILQAIYAFLGLLMLIIALLPGVMRYYRKARHP